MPVSSCVQLLIAAQDKISSHNQVKTSKHSQTTLLLPVDGLSQIEAACREGHGCEPTKPAPKINHNHCSGPREKKGMLDE
jgi:hypothetical protein|mmetsp:Transcript_56847/g.94311  ORF Transcript_56847/g.94311 Transcript_56847/m.94311 type:complete len:80 (+) Transcript_56847:696-935(+)